MAKHNPVNNLGTFAHPPKGVIRIPVTRPVAPVTRPTPPAPVSAPGPAKNMPAKAIAKAMNAQALPGSMVSNIDLTTKRPKMPTSNPSPMTPKGMTPKKAK